MSKRWLFPQADRELVRELSDRLRISPILAHVLVNRNISSVEAARLFLQPQLTDLHDPFLMPGMQQATERIRKAAINNEKVMVYGDYDVDGTTATALLVHFLRMLNMRVDYYVPHRIREGYGLNLEAVRLFSGQDVQLIITVDCGINAVEEVAQAQADGIDVIVTDHHEPGDTIPNACAVINPKLTGSMYPFRDLSGVGVAFKLAWATAQSLSRSKQLSQDFREFLLDAMGLVALGTIADVVPLLGENRVLARYGLHALQTSPRAGVDALIDSAGLRNSDLSSTHIGFRLAPRLNAAGRMAEARLCVELFTTDSTSEARLIAEKLDDKNRERQRKQEEILRSVRQKLLERGGVDHIHAIVMEDEGWHPGVLGIVAAKIADEFWRPTVLIAMEGDEGKGSARSVPTFNLFEALRECDQYLSSYGGHSQAAGIRIRRDNIDPFRQALESVAARQLQGENLTPAIDVDLELMLSDASIHLVREIEQLAPYGEGNRPPIFASSGLQIVGQPRLLGAQGQHLAFYVRQGDTSVRAISFGMGGLYDAVCNGARRCSLAYQPKISEWNGVTSLELEVRDIRLEAE